MTHTRHILLLLLALLPIMGHAQIIDAQGEYVDTTFHDHVDRTAPDFITASVCIADPTDWHDDFLGVLGHAFIRLQCPTFDMDLCFSYESENAEEETARFLQGDLHMGMFCVPTTEYIQPFQRWNCAIHEYTLHLSPQAEQRLWEIMDRKVAEGQDMEMDLVRRGCTQTLVQFVEQALGEEAIQYGTWSDEYSLTRRQIIHHRLEPYPWIRILCCDLFLGGAFNDQVANESKILVPAQMIDTWQHATVQGHPLVTYSGELVEAPAPQVQRTWLTPMVCAIALLVLTLAVMALGRWRAPAVGRYYTLALLVAQCLVGLALVWLVTVSNLPGSRGAHLLPLYCPLLLPLWRWRRYWAPWYALGLVAWGVTMTVHPAYYVEPTHLVLALALIVALLAPMIPTKNAR